MRMTASRIATHITAKAMVMATAKYEYMKDNECNEILPNMTLGVALELKTVPEALATMRQSSFK